MKQQKLSQNLIFQFLYQAIILVIPLVVSPYLSRVLQETAIGTYTYIHTIAHYFVIAANLGILKYGQRLISRNSDRDADLRKAFWSLFFLHTVVSLLLVLVYVSLISVLPLGDKTLYYIEGLYVLSALFDVTWLFYGMENFKSVVIRNAAVKAAECALIFALIKSPQDLWLYTLITACGFLLGQLVMFSQAILAIKPIKFEAKDLKSHVLPLLLFSVTVIASTLYTFFDKTLLGLMTNHENVAFYEYANRIVHLPATFIAVIGTVMMPRVCRLAAKGDEKKQRRYMNYSFLYASFIGFGAMFGLLAVGELFAVVYYGETFAICGRVMMALSPLALIIGLGDVVRTQYMIPNGMDKAYTFSIVMNAVLNLVLSMILIPYMGIYGAVVGTATAELWGTGFQTFCCRKHIEIKSLLKTLVAFLGIGALMYVSIKVVSLFLASDWRGLLIEILVGGVIYVGLSLIYILLFHKDIKHSVISKIKRRSHATAQTSECAGSGDSEGASEE